MIRAARAKGKDQNDPNHELWLSWRAEKAKLKKQSQAKNNQATTNPALPPREPTLLRKLLASEIRRERSLALQCLRFFVDEDFFLCGS